MSKTLRQTDLSKILVLMGRVPLRFFQDILREVQDLQPIQRQLIDHVIVVCKLIYVNPATSATGERSFSTARRIKTWLRSKMLQARFNHLAILNAHNDRFDKFCLVSVANSFVSLNENHERNVGKFTTADLSCLITVHALFQEIDFSLSTQFFSLSILTIQLVNKNDRRLGTS